MESSDSINTDKMYVPGDFSFFSKSESVIFEYDYKIVNKIGDLAWSALKNYKCSPNNYIIEIINLQLYPGHTRLTYISSLENLICIANHGWNCFVENHINLKNEMFLS